MPAYEFSYTQPMNYAELRDASGRLVGLAEPGDRRIFDEAPDHMWTEVTFGGEDERGGIGSDPDPADVPGEAPGSQEGTAGNQPGPAGDGEHATAGEPAPPETTTPGA